MSHCYIEQEVMAFYLVFCLFEETALVVGVVIGKMACGVVDFCVVQKTTA